MIQIAGALLILAAFTAAQAGRVDPTLAPISRSTVAGSVVLAHDALRGCRSGGFVLLEAVWAFVSAWGLLRALLPQTRAADAARCR